MQRLSINYVQRQRGREGGREGGGEGGEGLWQSLIIAMWFKILTEIVPLEDRGPKGPIFVWHNLWMAPASERGNFGIRNISKSKMGRNFSTCQFDLN